MSTSRKPTATSSFGVGRREAHDATDFYARFPSPTLSDDDTVEPYGVVDEIYCLDARAMDEGRERVKDNSVALMVTSPPYFAGKAYELEMGTGHVPASYVDYLKMLHDVFAVCAQKLEPGGRMAVNVANLGRKPYRSLSSDVIRILQDDLGLLPRGEIIWRKGQGASGSCAWGSFQSAAAPTLRDLTERVVVVSKGRFNRAIDRADRPAAGLPFEDSITKDEFMEATLDVWDIPAESASRVNHPAPYPIELPQRLIELYTYRDDLVLDPFMGSGTTAVAAVRTGRHYVGFDTDRSYVQAAKARIADEQTSRRDDRRPVVALPPKGQRTAPASAQDELAAGEQAKVVTASLLAEAGFTHIDILKRPVRGVDVTIAATDRAGGQWYVEVVGGITSTGTGLRSNDAVYRVLGKATALRAAQPDAAGFLVVSPGLPGPRSQQAIVLRRAADTIDAIVDLLDPATPAALARLADGSG